MREVFKNLVGYFVMITINKLKRSVFSKNKDQDTGAKGNDDG